MIKKILTLSSIVFLLVCTYLNGEQFKLENKFNKPIFIRLFEKKNGVLIPPLNNFTLLTLDKGQEKNYTFEGQVYLGISFTDPALVNANNNNKLEVKFFKFTPGKNVDIYVSEKGCLIAHFKKGCVNKHDCEGALFEFQKNEKGKWKLSQKYLPDKSEEKFIIQKPTIIEYEQPLPQTIKVTE